MIYVLFTIILALEMGFVLGILDLNFSHFDRDFCHLPASIYWANRKMTTILIH